MKKLIILILLVGCKKQTTVVPQANVTPPIVTAVPDKTVTVYSKAYGGGGYIRINWVGDDTLSNDSVYTYSPIKYSTRILKADSIDLFFYTKACGSCPLLPTDIVVTVNGIVKWSISGNTGNLRYNVTL
jgi:hypothetical protein